MDSVTIRHPWGSDGTSANDGNPDDGYITLTPTLLGQFDASFSWGKV